MSFNARSIRNKLLPVMSYLEEKCISLAFVQETWIKKSDTHLIREIEEFGYKVLLYRKPRRLDLGGGVAVIYRKSLKIHPVKIRTYRSFECISCKIMTEEGTYMFSNIYRPDYSMKNRYTVPKFIEEFSSLVDEIQAHAVPFMFLGDYNLHVETLFASYSCSLSTSYEIKKKKEASAFLQVLQSNDLLQLIDKPTHEQGGTLDLLIMNNDICDFGSWDIVDKNIVCESDHFPIYFTMNVNALVIDEKVTFTYRDFSSFNKEIFLQDFSTFDIISATGSLNVSDTVVKVHTTLSCILEKQCPSVTKTVRMRDPLCRRWFNDSLRSLKRKKRRQERAWLKCKCFFHREQYDEVLKEYKQAIYSARSESIIKTIETNSTDPKSLYKSVKNLVGDNDVSVYPSSSSSKQLADDMADFYSNKIINIRKEIKNNSNISNEISEDHYNFLNNNISTDCILHQFVPLSEKDTRDLIKSMANKHHHEDPIPVWLLKENEDELYPVIQSIINKSLIEGTFPASLKHGTVRPILKEKNLDQENYKNYRPVTNTPFMSKLIEKAANNQITEYLEQNGLFPAHQSAYRKKHSCETVMLKIIDDIQESVSEKKMVMLVLLDLSSAFDTIDQDILLFKLMKHFGISGNVLKWIKTYLKGRTFSVRIKNVNGKVCLLIYGVPQGTVLGPLLFIMYIHDLILIGDKYNVSVELYADDSRWYYSFSPLYERTFAMDNINKCMSEIKLWMQYNYLKINFDKTDVLYISNPFHHSVFYGNIMCTIEGENFINSINQSVKSLGVTLDNNLTMKKMVLETVKSCYSSLKKLGGVRRYLPQDIKLKMVMSYIISRLDFCNGLYANISKTLLNKLQKLLNACVRFVMNIPNRMNVNDVSKSLHILPVKNRIMFKLCLIVYKILKGSSPEYLKDKVVEKIPTDLRFLRSSLDLTKLELPKSHNTYQYSMAKNWNALPISIRNCNTVENFKKQLKTHYFTEAYL